MRNTSSVWVILVFAFVAGCGGGGKTDNKMTITKAWGLFAAKDYQAALDNFEALIASDGSTAIVGAGWCNIRLGQLAQAEGYFAQASTDDPDGLVGWSLVLWGNGDPQAAIDKATAALQISPQYVFSRDTRVDFRDMVWIQAASYFQLHDYAACLSKIITLDALFTTNLNDPNIDQILLAKLQALGSAHE